MAKKKRAYDFYATGRRKTSVARVFARTGTGAIKVNGKPLVIPPGKAAKQGGSRGTYFTRETCEMISLHPLDHLGMRDRLDFDITVRGGGEKGQAGAISLGIARVLMQQDEAAKPLLKQEGLTTRDSRAVERKKVGLRKARRAKQFSKR